MAKPQKTRPHDEPIELVVTAALEAEIPRAFFRAHGVPVCTFKSLRAGGLAQARNESKRSMLVVLTGVGPAASALAAQWIREHIRPLFVVNVGTAGCPHSEIQLGTWLAPNSVRTTTEAAIHLESRLPFQWPAALARRSGGTLLSVRNPLDHADARSFAVDGIDMEAAAQASEFGPTGISFCVLKFASDRCDANAEVDMVRCLSRVREEIQAIFSFLEAPSEPKISVIIPVCNRKMTMRNCVESVLSQTLAPLEVIVVDDGSTDGTADVVRGLGAPTSLIELPKNQGVAHARNRGTSQARGDWIAFIDSDDAWEKNKLQGEWEFLARHPFYRIAQTDEIWIRNGVRVNPRNHHAKPRGWIWEPSLERCLVSPSAVLIERALFQSVGGFDEALPVCEDYDLWLRLARRWPVGLDPAKSVIKQGGHADQLSRRFPAMDRFRVYALLKALRSEEDPRYRSQLMQMAHKKLCVLIQGAENRGLTDHAIRYRSLDEALDLRAPTWEELQWLIES